MLDTDTKRRIDTCRDILVGKLPDPKSQVEQITIALIYKFMDDMDTESEAMGGARSFFTGEFAKYRWQELMAPGMGGFDMLGRYADAISRMNENPGIPALFRDIFKNAYLPYRDPETLRSFLKEIHGFRYDHSERLGDAFEYLLSVLGSQGDAGQFRTPRHIIDFMVAIVDPKKTDTILDPACGTAGFLISAWKHIRAANSKDRPGDRLTPAERKNLADSIQGYDISPDMVRLSLVNMYLHGFADPHIFEYDTLTSEDRWNDYFDVILANPPFMSPKGGIRPHKRFSVQSKRSEVLFVDYMAEHLTSRGRAGIIVPEGIIFQSQTAYKQLRRMLVENSLVAVISLPSGCFNPYSGVKTSILILDKQLAKRTDEILFVKVENDGFGLGAQRRKIEKDDLPEALGVVKAFLADHGNGESEKEGKHEKEGKDGKWEGMKGVLVVSRKRIGESGEWNLSGERYLEAIDRASNHPLSRLDDISKILNGYAFKSENYVSEGIRIIRITNVQKGRIEDGDPKFYPLEIDEPISKYTLHDGDLLISLTGNVGRVGLLPKQFLPAALNQRVACIRPDEHKILKSYLFYLLNLDTFEQECIASSSGVAQKNLSTNWLAEYKIPLPLLAVQQEIVAEIEGYQKVIDGARQVVENYRPHIHVEPEWPLVPLEKTCEIQRGKFSHRPRNEPRFYGGKYPFIQTGDIVRANGGKITYTQTLNEDGLSVSKLFQPPIVVITIAANIGDTAVLDFPSCFPDSVVGLIPKPGTDTRYLELAMRTKKQHLNDIAPQAAQKNINIEILKTVKIPIPPLSTQRAIVSEIEEEQQLVEANRELIRRFEAKIKETMDRVWGE